MACREDSHSAALGRRMADRFGDTGLGSYGLLLRRLRTLALESSESWSYCVTQDRSSVSCAGLWTCSEKQLAAISISGLRHFPAERLYRSSWRAAPTGHRKAASARTARVLAVPGG